MKHNFGAGPCILPQEVFQEASQAVLNFNDTGLSILEISHRSKEFEAVMTETEQLVRELLSIPQGYAVVFLQGGASTQFALVPRSEEHTSELQSLMRISYAVFFCNTKYSKVQY